MHKIHIVDNVISSEDAQTLISEMNNPSESNPYPAFYENRNGGTALPYNKTTLGLMKKYGDKTRETVKALYNLDNDVYVTKSYSSHWTEGSFGGPHIDDQEKEPFIEYSAVIYLNEHPDFDGGKIYFPQKDFEYNPVKFSAVFFPQKDVSYIHGITEVTRGHRYTFLFHYSSDINFADPDLIG